MLSVVLGRATRAGAIHITGITCEGVAVSSDVFDSPEISLPVCFLSPWFLW